jgi:hypothetical protein
MTITAGPRPATNTSLVRPRNVRARRSKSSSGSGCAGSCSPVGISLVAHCGRGVLRVRPLDCDVAACEARLVRLVPRAPVYLDPAVDDPALVHRLIDAHAPYWPVQRYFANDAEYAALSGRDASAGMIVAPGVPRQLGGGRRRPCAAWSRCCRRRAFSGRGPTDLRCGDRDSDDRLREPHVPAAVSARRRPHRRAGVSRLRP